MTGSHAAELDLLRSEVATLTELLSVHEEQASQQFELIRAQRRDLEDRTVELDVLNDELLRNASFLRELYRAMPSALLVFGPDNIVETANEAAHELLGYAEGELVGQPVSALVEASDPFSFQAVEERSACQGALRAEGTMLSKTSSPVDVLWCVALTGTAGQQEERKAVFIALDIRERKRLEVDLRQAQKLESVGRLAAGVAHEINTPIQFVSDSVQFLRDASEDLIALIAKLRLVKHSVLQGSPSAEAAEQASEAEEEADLDHLVHDVPAACDRALEGLNRVAQIVRSMRDFAHPDVTEMTSIDLNRAIESTIAISRGEYKYVADLETDFGDLPLVLCQAGDINQVILNILVNAAHAIGDVVHGTGSRGRIFVRTRHEEAHVTIAIKDTGGGIPERIRDRIFDPFFTTKEVGKGTGQGLAIARSIVVDKHMGTLSFESELGKGTTFIIRLPVDGRRMP